MNTPLIQSTLSTFHLKVDGKEECRDLAAAIRTKQAAKIAQDDEAARHAARRKDGVHVVALKRCWECGRTMIIGELDDKMRAS